MQWEQDLEKAIIDADAMSTASSDAALMIGLDRMSVTGTDNNTMSGVSSESGQQVDGTDSPKEQFYGESPIDGDDLDDREHLYQAYMREMENERSVQSDDFTSEPCVIDGRSEGEEFMEGKGEEIGQQGEDTTYDMYEDHIHSQKSLQEKDDSKETLSIEAGYSSPQAHFDEIAEAEIQEDRIKERISALESEEGFLAPAQEASSLKTDEIVDDDEKSRYLELEMREDAEKVEYIKQVEDGGDRVEITERRQASSAFESETGDQVGRAWFSELSRKDGFLEQTNYSYTFEENQEIRGSERVVTHTSYTDTFEFSSEYKASCTTSQSEAKSEVVSQLAPGHLVQHDLEGESVIPSITHYK